MIDTLKNLSLGLLFICLVVVGFYAYFVAGLYFCAFFGIGSHSADCWVGAGKCVGTGTMAIVCILPSLVFLCWAIGKGIRG